MSSFILSHDLHLMMLEIALIICDCKWSFVPWTTAFDKVILKKTIVIFRMLDNDWTSLSPNRHDSHPYQGSNYENEKFYDGSSVVFSMLTDFFEKKANGVNVQLYVRKQVYDGNVHFVRRELPEHRRHNFALHSDQLPRQMSHNGDHASQKYTRSILYSRRLDEKQPYFSRQLTSKELQSGCWDDDGLLRVSSGRLICCCEELVKKEVADLVISADKVADSTTISVSTVLRMSQLKERQNLLQILLRFPLENLMRMLIQLNKGNKCANTIILPLLRISLQPANAIANFAMTSVAEDVAAIKEELDNAIVDSTAMSVAKIADYGVLDVKVDAVAIAKTKGYAIKDNGERAFKKASSALSKSKRGRNTATIGITERGKKISPSSSSPFSSLQMYPLCCQLQPHLTYFTDCFDVSPCYCYWTACPFQFFYSA
ncbi:hypothetical protein ALC62_06367 [Cyphomyrmex costatus]|uniref:Uncharacterized protein n=1 Tax=Cyphomyrmex costatus TaxID=456900 RepID=A0A195CRQ0_9HYME|nr:hypothetical protein ALC62_06367 [Cyphomyrmex costatus]